MEQSLYNKLKTDLGLSDAVNEYIEVLVRKLESESLSEEEFQEIATKYDIKVNDVSVNDATSKIRGYYIVSTYQILEAYFTEFNDYLNKFSSTFRKKDNGESMLKYIYCRLLDMQRVNDEAYLYYLICDYYRLTRNYIAHVDNKRKIENMYISVNERRNDIAEKFPKLAAPNSMGRIGFDDFVLYSRSAKKLAKILFESVQYDLDKVANSIDLKRYAKYINSPDRYRNAIKYELQIRFPLKNEDVEFVVEKLTQKV